MKIVKMSNDIVFGKGVILKSFSSFDLFSLS